MCLSLFKYSSSVFVSSAILAKLIADTLTEPTLSAVPPIELKSICLYFHIVWTISYALCANLHFQRRINSLCTPLGEDGLYRLRVRFASKITNWIFYIIHK